MAEDSAATVAEARTLSVGRQCRPDSSQAGVCLSHLLIFFLLDSKCPNKRDAFCQRSASSRRAAVPPASQASEGVCSRRSRAHTPALSRHLLPPPPNKPGPPGWPCLKLCILEFISSFAKWVIGR